jgi:putative hydroxymethylpyrimidine transport system substrate-binding protein
MRSLGGAILLALVLAAALAGCGGGVGEDAEAGASGKSGARQDARQMPAALPPKEQDREMWVAMDGWDTAESIAFPMAEANNYFLKSQLGILSLSPVTAKLTIPDVVKGQDDVGVAHGPEAVLFRERGVPIVIFGSFVPGPTAAIIWPQGSGIAEVADLKGKTIAIPGLSFQRDFLEAILAKGGLTLDDVKVKSVGNDLVPALLHGRADAIFGGSANVEGAELRDHGVEPVAKPVGSFGVPAYEELVLVAREDWVAENPQSVQDLLAALARGAAAAVASPKAAADVLNADGESNPAVSRSARAVEVRETLPLLSEALVPSLSRTQQLIDWMYEQKMIKSKLSAADLLAASDDEGP